MRILVIEDDSAVQRALKRLFEPEGYSVELAKDGTSGLQLLRKTTPSLLLLDLRLPDISGEEICRTVTQTAPDLPIIVLSAKSDVADIVLLFELGACDYVTKPFSPRELLARVHVALRRSAQAKTEELFCFDDIAVNFRRMEVIRGGAVVSLTAHEFQMLKYMLQNQERVISRHELLREVWGYQNCPSTRTVDMHVLRLRHKLERDPTAPLHLLTVRGLGYKFKA
jgi:DNA-binding response OmpR family regulator